MKPMTTEIHDVIKMDREKIIRVVLYTKIVEKDLELSDNELSILCLFSDTDDKDYVIRTALKKRYVKSYQTGDNVVSKLVKLNILEKVDKKIRTISEDFFPKNPDETIAAKLIIHNVES